MRFTVQSFCHSHRPITISRHVSYQATKLVHCTKGGHRVSMKVPFVKLSLWLLNRWRKYEWLFLGANEKGFQHIVHKKFGSQSGPNWEGIRDNPPQHHLQPFMNFEPQNPPFLWRNIAGIDISPSPMDWDPGPEVIDGTSLNWNF